MSIIIPGKPGQVISIIVGFFTGAWGKFAIIALVSGLLLWQGRLWLNRHDDKIAKQAREQTIAVLETQYVATWQQKLTEAKNMADNADARYKATELQLTQVNMKIGAIFSTLSGIRKSVNDRQVIYVKETASIPRTELDNTIRALSNYISALPAH